ncbi:MAG TPA: hypothetical protein VN668_00760 [Stellaceae bacterium]|nr:hypothetical protein [Stellaceae bacterium]
MSYLDRMSEPAYTLKQVVSLLAPANDPGAPARIARQVRHWTARDLLAPLGGKRTGTGVSRRYTADEIRKAAILLELSQYRIPAPVLEDSFDVASHDWPNRSDWDDAVAGRKSIFLYMTYSRHITAYQLAPADAVITMLEPAPEKKREPMFEIFSAIVINLTRLFATLKL